MKLIKLPPQNPKLTKEICTLNVNKWNYKNFRWKELCAVRGTFLRANEMAKMSIYAEMREEQ